MLTRWILLPFLLTIWQGEKIAHTDSEWRELLGEKRYSVMRKKGTEAPLLGALEKEGTYLCAACELPLFHSINKYNSGSLWPNFTKPIYPKNVYYLEDWSMGFKRYEVLCSRCDSHLGHIFRDSPDHFRYCINSIALIIKS